MQQGAPVDQAPSERAVTLQVPYITPGLADSVLSTAPVPTAPSVVQSPPSTPVTAAPTLPAPGTVEPTAAASRAEPAPVQSIPEPSLAASIPPLSSADMVIRSREREDERPTIISARRALVP